MVIFSIYFIINYQDITIFVCGLIPYEFLSSSYFRNIFNELTSSVSHVLFIKKEWNLDVFVFKGTHKIQQRTIFIGMSEQNYMKYLW